MSYRPSWRKRWHDDEWWSWHASRSGNVDGRFLFSAGSTVAPELHVQVQGDHRGSTEKTLAPRMSQRVPARWSPQAVCIILFSPIHRAYSPCTMLTEHNMPSVSPGSILRPVICIGYAACEKNSLRKRLRVTSLLLGLQRVD